MLELKNISFSAESDGVKKDILDDVSLTVGDNRFVVITGPNGGGKSTLAKVIMGIARPDSGRILLDGEDITDAVRDRAGPEGHQLCLSAARALQGPDA
jgi:Fe-S cluster assembly ATP-binding protein